MSFLPREKWARVLVLSAYIILAAMIVYMFFGSILSLFLPFGFAFFIGWMLRSPTEKLYRRLKAPKRIISCALVLVVIFFLGFVVFLLANQLVSEAQRLFEKLSQNSENILSGAADLLDKLGDKFPFIYEYLDKEVINGTVTEVLKNIITTLSGELAATLTALVKSLPDIGLFFVVFVIASFYFAMDYDNITTALRSFPSKKTGKMLSQAILRLRNTGMGYLKAYSMILLITFAELFVGFLVLKVNYATTLAIVIALLDMLPIIGTGTVLVPWAIISMLMGNYPIGIGLLVLFGIITVVREVIEPKMIGNSIGMHPLLTLVAMYVGYKLFGLWGILLLPPAVNLAKTLFINYTPKDAI